MIDKQYANPLQFTYNLFTKQLFVPILLLEAYILSIKRFLPTSEFVWTDGLPFMVELYERISTKIARAESCFQPWLFFIDARYETLDVRHLMD